MFGNIRNTRYVQYIAAIAAASTGISIGLSMTWPSPSLPKLQSSESPVGRSISDEEGSWLVSVILLFSAVGNLIGAYTIEKFGGKRNILMLSLFTCIHFVMVSFARSFEVLLAARCLGGICMSAAHLACIVYAAEIAEVDIRGKLGTYCTFLKTSGNLMGNVIGPYISYTSLGAFSACIPISTITVFYFMPESPFYLVKVNQIDKARICLEKLSVKNSSSKNLDDKLSLIKETIEKDMRAKTSLKEFLGNAKYRYVIFLMIGIKGLQQFSGATILEAYLQPIIRLSRSGIEPGIASVIIGCIQVPAVFLSSILVDKLGRRPLLIVSALGCSVALFGEGTYFLIQDHLQRDTSSITWLPITGLVFFWIFSPIGILTLPYVLMGELFPTNIKEIGIASSALYGSVMGFVVSKFFRPMSNAIGMHFVFYIYAGVCFLGASFVFFFLPETKGKNFMEIQALIYKQITKGKSHEDEDCRTIERTS